MGDIEALYSLQIKTTGQINQLMTSVIVNVKSSLSYKKHVNVTHKDFNEMNYHLIFSSTGELRINLQADH